MKLVLFGFTITSSWGNGHAALWRGIVRALEELGHEVAFFERDAPVHAAHRDLVEIPGCRLFLYRSWQEARGAAASELASADAGMVTSSAADALAATDLLLDSRVPVRAFYDIDAAATLSGLKGGKAVPWIGPAGLAGFDLVLSTAGGGALRELTDVLGARRVAALYHGADPATYRRLPIRPRCRADLSSVGALAASRHPALDALLLEPARRRPSLQFLVGGHDHLPGFPWTDNLRWWPLPSTAERAAFFSSSPLTLSLTDGVLLGKGLCPSARMFQAAACGTPVLTDDWAGLPAFFEPEREVVVGRSAEDVLGALSFGSERLAGIGRAARERVLAEHTSHHRARRLVSLLRGGSC